MAKAYFHMVELFAGDTKLEIAKVKEEIVRIIDENAIDVDSVYALDITPENEEMHTIFDVFEYKGSQLFGRISRQHPKNTLIQHNYETYQNESVLPEDDETRIGIEKYTYCLFDYGISVLEIVNAQGAPNEKFLQMLFKKYSSDSTIKIKPIPNARAIEEFYKADSSEIRKLEIDLPLPSSAILENVLGWNTEGLESILDKDNLKMTFELKPIKRNQSIVHDTKSVKAIIDLIRSSLNRFSRASIQGRTQGTKLREYNFFEDKFSYEIDVKNYRINGGEKHFLSVDEMTLLYKDKIKESFRQNLELLKIIVGP